MLSKKIPEEVRNICDAAREAYEERLEDEKRGIQKALAGIVGKQFIAQCVPEGNNVYRICGHSFKLKAGNCGGHYLFNDEAYGINQYVFSLDQLGGALASLDKEKEKISLKPSWWQRIKEFFVSPSKTSLKL